MDPDKKHAAVEWIPHRYRQTLGWIDLLRATAGQRLATPALGDTPRRRYVQKVLEIDSRVLLSWLKKFTGDSQPLEDLLQEVYERLLRVDDARAETIRSVSGYAFGITRHVAHNWRSRCRNTPIECVTSLEELSAADARRDVETIVARQEELSLLLQEIRRLPMQCRKVLLLIKVFGHTAKEAAVHMGIAESTVKKQLQLAATRCQDALEKRALRPGLLLLSRLLGR